MALHSVAYLLTENGMYVQKIFAPHFQGKPVGVIIRDSKVYQLDLRRNPQVLNCASPLPQCQNLSDKLCYFEVTRAYVGFR